MMVEGKDGSRQSTQKKLSKGHNFPDKEQDKPTPYGVCDVKKMFVWWLLAAITRRQHLLSPVSRTGGDTFPKKHILSSKALLRAKMQEVVAAVSRAVEI